jgi:hypothetical protein
MTVTVESSMQINQVLKCALTVLHAASVSPYFTSIPTSLEI